MNARSAVVRVGLDRASAVPISRLVLGNFIELGLGRQASGMWSEMLYNRTFRVVPPATTPVWEWLRFDPEFYDARAPFWHSGYEENDWEPIPGTPTETFRTHAVDPFKGDDSFGVRNPRAGAAGIRQRGLHLKAGSRYRFALFGSFAGRKVTVPPELFDPARDARPETREVTVTLRSEGPDARIVVEETLRLLATQREHAFEFSTNGFTGRASLQIGFAWEGILRLSWASLAPLDNRAGWRADVVDLLRRVAPPVIRFPGGCFASFYDWRDGVGPRAARPVRVPYMWGKLEENDVGIDEFLQLCAMLRCEPQVCVNMMTGTPQQAAELVEYCNGADSSPMGRLRREHGVTRTNRVRYWEMDNEAGRKWSALEYAAEVVRFARRMREVDPDIAIMMEYYSWGIEWLPRMLEVAGGDVDVVIHRDADRSFMARALQILREHNRAHGRSIRQANTEWLPDWNSPEPFDDPEIPQTYDWEPSGNDYRKVLSFREIRWFYALSAGSRIIDYLSYGGEFALANFNNCVNTWGQNVIESSREGAWLSPAGRVFEFFRTDDSVWPLATAREPADDPMLNAQACEAADGGINLYAANRGCSPVRIDLRLPPGCAPRTMRILDAEHRLATNRLGDDRIRLRETGLSGDLVLPPISLVHLAIERGTAGGAESRRERA